MLRASQAAVISGHEEVEDCSPEWIQKIDRAIQAREGAYGSIRYVFPSFSQSFENCIGFKPGTKILEPYVYMTHLRCMDVLKQKYRDQGCTVSEGFHYVPGFYMESQHFIDIAWKPGWLDTYYDWKDRWLGSVKKK